jgi:hypothetical protein
MTHGATSGGHRFGCRSGFAAASVIACLAASPVRAGDATPPAAGALRAGDVRIDHLDYDWSLNER